MADEDHIEVDLDDAKVEKAEKSEPEVEVVEKADAAPVADAKSEVTPEEGITELKKKFELERKRAADAERMAAEARQQAHKASLSERDANYQLVVSAIETVKGRSESIRAAYVSAMSAGDYDKAAEMQEALAVNAQQLVELQRGEREIKAQLERQQRAPVEPMPRSQDPIAEQLAKQVSPRSAAWLRANKEAISDERAVKRMFRAHEDAVDDGIEPDSADYFAFIEQRLGIRTVEEDIPDHAPARAPAVEARKPSPPPAAPVSRGGQRPNVVRLTRAEAEMAKMMGMTEGDYAKNKVALQREGKLGN